jgi:microfibrillar-associated protein 1
LIRSQRETIKEREKEEIQEQEIENMKLERLNARKEESYELIARSIRREIAAENQKVKDPTLIDDTDDIDEEAEFEAWKLRELLRLKRDREEREQ